MRGGLYAILVEPKSYHCYHPPPVTAVAQGEPMTDQPAVLSAFREYLETTDLSTVSRKAMMSGLRRAVRDLSATDMTDPDLLAEYRDSLKTGTRNIHDAMWSHLSVMFSQRGIELADSARRSRVRFVQPLYSDLTLLGAVSEYHRIPSLTWADFAAGPHFSDPRVLGAAQRVWIYQTNDVTLPRPADTLVPNGPDRTPMREWRLRFIVNSRQHSSPREGIRLLSDLTEALCWAGIDGLSLRRLMDPIWADREALTRSKVACGAFSEATVKAKAGDVGGALHVLQHRLPTKR